MKHYVEFDEWNLKLVPDNDIISISLKSKSNYFQSSYKLKYFLHYKELYSKTMTDMIQYINSLFSQKKYKIKQNEEELIFTLIIGKNSSIDLILNNEDNNEISISLSEQEFKKLKEIQSIKSHDSIINCVSIFPSGKIISASSDKSIIIYNEIVQVIQKIPSAHRGNIFYIDIKDEYNFMSCSLDKTIKMWIKKNQNFELNKSIDNCHNSMIRKVIYCPNNKIISCSWDKTIKIWDENNCQNIKTLEQSQKINGILILKEENILVSSGDNGTIFYDLNDFKKIKNFDGASCDYHYALCKLNQNNIIVGGRDDMIIKVISISEKKVIKELKNDFVCWAILSIEKKGIFLVGGKNNNIKIFDKNYNCIQVIENAHTKHIKGFIELKNEQIASFSHDGCIKVWGN
jgi:WD40 repeat protein